jgi:branched-chain amino acid transport system substrate-binding protein
MEKKMSKKLFVFLSMLIVASMLLAACAQQPAAPAETEAPAAPVETEAPAEPAPSGEPIKVGLLAPLTGAVPTFGQSTREGAELAVKEWNAKGGINGRQIELIVEDSQCEADPAVNAANKLIDQDGVKFLIGEVCSKASIPVSELANEKGVIQISPTSTNPSVTLNQDGSTKEYIFRACFIDPFQGFAMAKFANGKGYKSAFLMYDQGNDYTVGLAEAFEETFQELGGEILGKETYTSTDTDFSAILTKVKDSGAEVLWLPDYYNIVNLVGPQAKQLGVTAVMMGGDGWDSSDLDVVGADGGFYSNHYDASDPRPIVQEFLPRYGAEFKDADGNPKVPDALATLAYDAANILFAAIQNAGTDDTAAVAKAMATGTFEAVSGTVTYDEFHNPIKNAVVLGVSDGNKAAVESVAP